MPLISFNIKKVVIELIYSTEFVVFFSPALTLTCICIKYYKINGYI